MNNHFSVEDFSCEIEMPINYLDFIVDLLDQQQNKDGDITLNKTSVEAIRWMLSTSGTIIHHINEALYGKNAKIENAALAKVTRGIYEKG
jgi:hypothetical protein